VDPLPSKRDLKALPHDQGELMRLFILDPWFRIVSVLILVVVVGIAISLPKIWRVTPPGFQPQVRVSLLNLAQAWQLRRSARQLAAKGSDEEAAAAWRAAVIKNLGHLPTIRQALRATVSLPHPPAAALEQAAKLPAWLVALGGTNAQDIGLVAQLCDRTGRSDEVYDLLHPLRDDLSREDEVLYLKALLDRGDGPAYRARWERLSAESAQDPTLALYHAAYLAGWGPLPARDDARRRLEQALEDPAHRILATRLQLLDFEQAQDPDNYAKSLERLVESRADRLRDHLGYWKLLAQAGRSDQARSLAAREVGKPRSAKEAILLADALNTLELPDQAHLTLRQFTMQQGGNPSAAAQSVWLKRAALLSAAADWRGLLEMAEELRAFPQTARALGGWTDFIEGRAHHMLKHLDQANASMQAAARGFFPSPRVALEVGLGLKELGYHDKAWQVLAPLEQPLKDVPYYWQVVFELAEAMRQDPVLLLRAATEARLLLPGDDRWDFNYAAALLINRLDPARVVSVTRDFLARMPASPHARVNHCYALALNQRWDEASELLSTVDPARFDEFGRSVFHLCAFEIHLAQGQTNLARLDAAEIRREHLFPNQIRWLDAALRDAGLADLIPPR